MSPCLSDIDLGTFDEGAAVDIVASLRCYGLVFHSPVDIFGCWNLVAVVTSLMEAEAIDVVRRRCRLA